MKQLNIKKYIIIVCLVLVSFIVMICTAAYIHNLHIGNKQSRIIEIQKMNLLDTEVNTNRSAVVVNNNNTDVIRISDSVSESIVELFDDLDNYLDRLNGFYGVYFYDIEKKEGMGINESIEFVAASTIKVPLNLLVNKMIQHDLIEYEEMLEYREYDYEEGTGEIFKTSKFGDEFSIGELCRLSITKSDNVATNMLLRKIGKNSLKDFMYDLGGTVVVYGKNVSSPRDMAVYLANVYDFYESGSVNSEEMLDNMCNTLYNERIPKLLPDDIKIAHKIGNQHMSYHDVGIIFAKRVYILSVMSKNASKYEAFDAIAAISKMVYDYVENS